MVVTMEPLPENISGEKRVVHRIEHNVQWGHVVLGAAAILLIYVVFDPFSSSESDGDDTGIQDPGVPVAE